MHNLKKYHFIFSACMMIIALVAFPQGLSSADDPLLSEWNDFAGKPECKKLISWLQCQARARLAGTRCKERFESALPAYYGSLGVFVTLKKGNKVRGCFGAFSHTNTDGASLLADYLAGALTRDPRYGPLDVSELADTRIIITIATQPFPVDDVHSIDARIFGIALQCGNNTEIYVPAEIRSMSLIENKLKDSSCQVSMFRAVMLQ